jgi:hypothetical protein
LLRGKGWSLDDVRDAIGKITDVNFLRARSNSGKPVLYYLGLLKDEDVKGDWFELDTLGQAEERAEAALNRADVRAQKQLSKAIAGDTQRHYRYVPISQPFLSQLSLPIVKTEGKSVHDALMVLVSMLRSSFTKAQSRVPRDLKDAQINWDVLKHRTITRDGRFCYQISIGCADPDVLVKIFCCFDSDMRPELFCEKPDNDKFGVPISHGVSSGVVSEEEVKRQEPLPPRRRKSRKSSRPDDLGPSRS